MVWNFKNTDMAPSKLINISQCSICVSILAQLVTFCAPGWLIYKKTVKATPLGPPGGKLSQKCALWYFIACHERYERYQGNTNDEKCVTISYHHSRSVTDIYPVNMAECFASSYSTIVQYQVEMTAALVTSVLVMYMVWRQKCQNTLLLRRERLVGVTRSNCVAVFVFSTVAAILVLVPTIYFIKLSISLHDIGLFHKITVSVPYCTVAGVVAVGGAVLVAFCQLLLVCRRQEPYRGDMTHDPGAGMVQPQMVPLVAISPGGPEKGGYADPVQPQYRAQQ